MPKTTKLQRLINQRANAAKVRELVIRQDLAKVCDVSPAFVYQWCQGIRPIPAAYAIEVESFFGADKYSRYEIAPDVFKRAA